MSGRDRRVTRDKVLRRCVKIDSKRRAGKRQGKRQGKRPVERPGKRRCPKEMGKDIIEIFKKILLFLFKTDNKEKDYFLSNRQTKCDDEKDKIKNFNDFLKCFFEDYLTPLTKIYDERIFWGKKVFMKKLEEHSDKHCAKNKKGDVSNHLYKCLFNRYIIFEKNKKEEYTSQSLTTENDNYRKKRRKELSKRRYYK